MPPLMRKRAARPEAPPRDFGHLIALLLCILFAVVGAVPLGVGLLLRTDPVRRWAAAETARLLRDELGLTARYEVAVQAWPMRVDLDNLIVDATDGGGPFLTVERVAVRPRPFSLLAGKLDAGDVEIIGPRLRLVVDHGAIANLKLTLPESKADEGPVRPPLASVAVTDARIDATIDGAHLDTREVDADVTVEEGQAFEIALHAGTTAVTRVHGVPGRETTEDAVDEDVLCRLDARVRLSGRSVLVRRLDLQGSVDFDPDPGTRPSCALDPGDWRALSLRLGALRLTVPEKGPVQVGGRLHAQVPASLVHRFLDIPHVTGSLVLDLEGSFDGVSRLPSISGHVAADLPGFDGKVFAEHLDLDLGTENAPPSADPADDQSEVVVSKLKAHWGGGVVSIGRVGLKPFARGIPLESGPITVEGVELPDLLRDLGVHPRAHVAWTLDKGHFEHLKGTLDPPLLEGPLAMSTHGFEIFNRPTIDPQRGHMMAVREANLRGTFVINGQARSRLYKFPGVVFSNFSVDTPGSSVRATVSIGFAESIDIQVGEGSEINLAELSPLLDIPLSGVATVKASGGGPIDHPRITGDLSIKDFVFGGFPVGDLESSHVTFEPLWATLTDAHLRHGKSRARSPLMKIAFDEGPDVLIDGEIDSREAPFLELRDLFEVFHFDKDPRWADYAGLLAGKARVHYAVGGPEDHCGGGVLGVTGRMDLKDMTILAEKYESGTADFDLLWDDQAAGADGMVIDLRSATLRKGSGSALATATVRHGGVVRGSVIGSAIPVDHVDAFGSFGKLFDGSFSFVADIDGTLGDFGSSIDLGVSRLRIGPQSLPPSHLSIAIEQSHKPPKDYGKTSCKNPRAGVFDPAEYDKDLSAGLFRVNGSLFEGQIVLGDVELSRQRRKVLEKGTIVADKLDLGTLSNLVPGVAFARAAPQGTLSATLKVKDLPLDKPDRGELALTLQKLSLAREGNALELAPSTAPIALRGNELSVPELRAAVETKEGLKAGFVVSGKVHRALTAPDLDLSAKIDPIDLARLSAGIKGVERAAGKVDGEVKLLGALDALRTSGSAHLRKGELKLAALPVPLSDINLDVEIGSSDLRLKNARARVGGGTIEIGGRMPFRGADAGAASGNLIARGVKVPVAEGVDVTADADLEMTYQPSSDPSVRSLPDVKGNVSLTSFQYTRPIGLSLSLNQLGNSQRTSVETYDPADDVVKFAITVGAPHPLHFTNNLVEMDLSVTEPGLVLSGTNQRFGARGQLQIMPDSKLQLRNNEFLVREGTVRFDDPYRIAPKVDVRAQTEYRRYTSSTVDQASAGAATASSGTSTGAGGLWRITLRAQGDANDLKVTLTSDPGLSQEDIVLLLTIGMTRAELDRGSASSLGETVGLEALSALTGADKAVKTIVPLIDEFRFGNMYSSKTGRTEPTVTVGKRITEDIRATVTTGITENREVRSNVEWRLNRGMSVQGSYDNVNDVSGFPGGNIGADLRFRLEFE
ncbi:MAG: translocation/assembly module TamB domain-containing protein [Byssovorax sp.]